MKFASLALRSFICLVLVTAAAHSIKAQDSDAQAREIITKALTLYQQGRYAEALPYMEMLVAASPDTGEIRFAYGVCLLGKSKQISDTEEAKQLSAKALEQFSKAKALGYKNPEMDQLMNLLSGKAVASPDEPAFSNNKEADKLMVEAENFFAQSKYDEAVKRYEKALAIDPKIYQAALGGGDCYTAKSDWANAEKWYQQAITIDPNRETAYRYSGTPLMKQQKFDLALDRYIEAYITEPYNNMSRRGISQWAEITGAKLAHPTITLPEITFDEKGKAVPKLTIDANDPASKPLLAYMATREAWKKDKFARAFPKETAYRHSLPEEVEAIRAAIAAADQKSSDPQLTVLKKLDSEGLLEAYILMARPDKGIAADHPDYLKGNRPKLREYVANYVIHK